jgi:hypothetical protein
MKIVFLLAALTTLPGPVQANDAACPSEKIEMEQATGCLADGSVEFCLPLHDDAIAATVLAIAPDAHPVRGGGRARCDRNIEQLWFYPLGQEKCEGAEMTDATWADLCKLAAQPEIARIVKTWYE